MMAFVMESDDEFTWQSVDDIKLICTRCSLLCGGVMYLCETRRSLWVIYSFCFPVCQHDFAQSCDWIFTQNSWERFQQRL